MAKVTSDVFPVYENEFKIGVKGKSSASEDMKTIAELETFQVSFDNNIEEWTPMTSQGWKKRMQTGKAFSISLSGKRCIGDEGNDYIAGLAWLSGHDVESAFEWIMPDGTTIKLSCLVQVTNVGGGDSTNVGGLELEVMSNGKPEITDGKSETTETV